MTQPASLVKGSMDQSEYEVVIMLSIFFSSTVYSDPYMIYMIEGDCL